MNIKELIAALEYAAEKCPEGEVRMEVYNRHYDTASTLNTPAGVSIDIDQKRITIVGDGEPCPY